MILLPKYKTITAKGVICHLTYGCKGELRFVKYNSMGQVNYDSGWTPNRWLDQGMDNWPAQVLFHHRYFALGDSAAAIVDTQTGLQGTYLGSTSGNNGISDYNTFGGNPDYEGTRNMNKRFNAGNGTGTVREVVISDTSGNPGSNANIRALVSPAIVKAADETLDVFYKWTVFPPLTDSIDNTVEIEGLTYDTTGRIYDVADTGSGPRPERPPAYTIGSNSQANAYGDGADLIAVTASSGWGGAQDATDSATQTATTYVPGDHYRDWSLIVGLNGWVTGTGIRVATINARYRPLQVKFVRQGGGGETVPKDNTKIIENCTWRLGWARH